MSITDIDARDTASVVRIALEQAEQHICPTGAHSRLWIAIRLAEATVDYYTHPSVPGYEQLAIRLRDCKTVEEVGWENGDLPVGGLHQMGLSLSMHVAQHALAGTPPSVKHVLDSARGIVRLAARTAA